MALPKKGSRTIIVNDEPYLWRVSPNTVNKVLNGGMGIAIQSAQNAILYIKIDFLTAGIENDWNRYTFLPRPFDEFVVTPSVVRKFILYALSQGWNTNTTYHLNIPNELKLNEILTL